MNDVINKKAVNYINNQLKNINLLLNNALSEIKKIIINLIN